MVYAPQCSLDLEIVQVLWSVVLFSFYIYSWKHANYYQLFIVDHV